MASTTHRNAPQDGLFSRFVKNSSASKITETLSRSTPVRATLGAANLLSVVRPGNWRLIEQAYAADEAANKETAMSMRGYRMRSLGRWIREIHDSHKLKQTGVLSMKTMACAVTGSVVYNAGIKPFVFGMQIGGMEGAIISAVAFFVGAGAVFAGKNMLASIDAAWAKGLKAGTGGKGSYIAQSGGIGGGVFGAVGMLESWASTIVRNTIGGSLDRAVSAWANRHVTDSAVMAFAHFLFGSPTWGTGVKPGLWASIVSGIQDMARATGMKSLQFPKTPARFQRSLAYDGLLPTGESIGATYDAKVGEVQLGSAARRAVRTGAFAFASAALACHPAVALQWTNYLDPSHAHLMSAVLDPISLGFDVVAGVAAGIMRGVGELRKQLAKAFDTDARNVKFNENSIEQISFFPNPQNKDARESNDRAFVKQLKSVAKDTSPIYQLGTFHGVLNSFGQNGQPIAGTICKITLNNTERHILITGGTGSGKTYRILTPLIIQDLEVRANMLIQAMKILSNRASYDEFRPAEMFVNAFSMVLLDTKCAITKLGLNWATLAGQREHYRLIGPRAGEFTLDILAGVSPQLAMDLIEIVINGAAGGSKEKIWSTLAKQVSSAAATLAYAFQATDEGLIYAVANKIKPYSLKFIYEMLMDHRGGLIEKCIEAVMGAVERKDGKVMPFIDSTLPSAIAFLVGESWMGAPAPETKMGVLVNIINLLSGIVAHPVLGMTFGSGGGENVISFEEFWGDPTQGAIISSNMSTDEFGSSAAILNSIFKMRGYLQATLRQKRFEQDALDAENYLRDDLLHLLREELLDESLEATRNYLAKQKAGWRIIKRFAAWFHNVQGDWPLYDENRVFDAKPNVAIDDAPEDVSMFGPGIKQAQYRRAKRWLDRLFQKHAGSNCPTLSDAERALLDEPELYLTRAGVVGGGLSSKGDTSKRRRADDTGHFSGAERSLSELLGESQARVVACIRGLPTAENMLRQYINCAGAPACPSEGLPAVTKAIDRHPMRFVIDEYTNMVSLAAPGSGLTDDKEFAKVARSTGVKIVIAFQSPATLEEAVGGKTMAESLTDNFRMKIFLPDETGQTFQIIKNLTGTVKDYDQSKWALQRQEHDYRYAHVVREDGWDAARDGHPDLVKNPTIPSFEADGDWFVRGRTPVSVQPGELPKKEDFTEAMFALAPFMGELGRVKGKDLKIYEKRSKYATINRGDNEDAVNAEKRGEEDKAENRDAERLAVNVRVIDPIDPTTWRGDNLAYFYGIIGDLAIQDLVDLDQDPMKPLNRVRAKLNQTRDEMDAAEVLGAAKKATSQAAKEAEERELEEAQRTAERLYREQLAEAVV
ncbi:TraM-binding TraD/TraG-like protein [Paraburkholderia fungorum]|jgi:hypothetical protein|uniref:type IV secretory system conjugative DNA transfer family protein n=1 Tax=Paraburkholderia fungorum TaxID=134537 RepID=UPI000D0601BE|nr:type IV secretory system conjugative DNA transfer family protein [Paraburkholderia fungorum]PRZ56395.1 TraM-binding TraD/TraG-like protein [Paraburkholderia fungorum]